jgi:hypothetical protein
VTFDFPVMVLSEIAESKDPYRPGQHPWPERVEQCGNLVSRGLAREVEPGVLEITEAGRAALDAYDLAVEEGEREQDAEMAAYFDAENERQREIQDDYRRW